MRPGTQKGMRLDQSEVKKARKKVTCEEGHLDVVAFLTTAFEFDVNSRHGDRV